MSAAHASRRQGGMALLSSLLLLLIITILALSMFRSFGVQEHIAGNLREKDRALHAAESAQQYAEYWLISGGNVASGSTVCAQPLDANLLQGQICSNTLTNATYPQVTQVPLPWALATTYTPTGMSVTPGTNGANGDPPYFAAPGFYITDLGLAADAQGEAYRIDAYGYAGAAVTVAIVESTYEVQQGVVNRGGL